MKTLGRNDPCPCGSGKKYKHCCLQKEETQATNDWSGAVPRALRWLKAKYPEALRETLDYGFFGSLNENDYNQLQHHESFQGIRAIALEWLLAEGTITVKGNERPVSEMLLGPEGPLFSASERQYLELLAAAPLSLYEVVGVTPGKCMTLKDTLVPERQPALVREKTASENVVKFDLIAARIIPADHHNVLSGALYSIPRNGGLELIGKLRKELDGLSPDLLKLRKLSAASFQITGLSCF
jgi:hypothetical protein